MTGRLKRHYVVVTSEDGGAVYESDPLPDVGTRDDAPANKTWRDNPTAYRLWQDDLSTIRAVEIAIAMNALETQRSKDRRAEAARRRDA